MTDLFVYIGMRPFFIECGRKEWHELNTQVKELFNQLSGLDINDEKRAKIICEIKSKQEERNDLSWAKKYARENEFAQYNCEIGLIDNELDKLGANKPQQSETTNKIIHLIESRDKQWNLRFSLNYWGVPKMLTRNIHNSIKSKEEIITSVGYYKRTQNEIITLIEMKKSIIKTMKKQEPSKIMSHEVGIISL